HDMAAAMEIDTPKKTNCSYCRKGDHEVTKCTKRLRDEYTLWNDIQSKTKGIKDVSMNSANAQEKANNGKEAGTTKIVRQNIERDETDSDPLQWIQQYEGTRQGTKETELSSLGVNNNTSTTDSLDSRESSPPQKTLLPTPPTSPIIRPSPKMRKDIMDYCKQCDTCQHTLFSTQAPQ